MNSINGLILAGGESLRMGKDKSLLSYHGKPQREYLFELLSPHCSNVFTSCKSAADVPAFLNPIEDKFDFKSPLNGILSVLSFQPHSAWLSVPVDMPFIDSNILKVLISGRDTSKVATCFFDSEGINPEPLFAIWEPSAFPLMMTYYESGRKSARGFLTSQEIKILKSPDPKMHVNINLQEDFLKFVRPKD
jgi:molybdopterin-guanine dinucleotide biosynthesis protein A